MTGCSMIKVTFDVETSPNIVATFGLFNQNIGINQILTPSKVICWAAKFYDEKQVRFASTFHDGEETMVKQMHEILEQTESVITYNGNSFDLPQMARMFQSYDLKPPAPSRRIDLYRTVKSVFKFPSSKLDYVCQELGIGAKTAHAGMDLWLKCMENDTAAWNLMRQYNRNDVVLTEKLYDKLLPWIPNHPSESVDTGGDVCPNCGSFDLQRRGFSTTKTAKYQR